MRSCRLDRMFLAGVSVNDDLVLELARLIDDPQLAARLEEAFSQDAETVGLTVEERETIRVALDEPPSSALAELRAVLIQEHVARVRGDGA